MSKFWTFEKERLKSLVTVYLNTGYDFDNCFPPNFKKPLTLYFHEIIPMIQLGDGFNFIEAVFTKEAVNSFRKNFSHLCLSSMRDRLLKLTKWSLQLKQRASSKCFNSYKNLGVYLVISDFTPLPSFSVTARQGSHAKNLFSDESIQVLIQHTRFQFIKSLIEMKHLEQSNLGFGKFEMPTTKTLQTHTQLSSQSLLLLNVIRLNQDATVLKMNETNWFECLRKDKEDFDEFKLEFNPEEIDVTSEDSLFLNSNLYDVQKLLIQEKGEDRYYEIRKKKCQSFKSLLEDQQKRERLLIDLSHFQVGFSKVTTIQESVKAKPVQKKPNQSKIICYNIGLDAESIKKGIVKLLTCVENQRLEQLRKLHSDDSVLQTRSMAELETIEYERDVQPLSQYIMNEQSQLIDDGMMSYSNCETSETESELDDEVMYNQNLLKKIPVGLKLYREYLLWCVQCKQSIEQIEDFQIREPIEQNEIGLDDLLGNHQQQKVKFQQTKIESESAECPSDSEEVQQNSEDEAINHKEDSELGKRRFRNPTLITELITKMRSNGESISSSFNNSSLKQQEIVFREVLIESEEDFLDDDPRTATQLCNNDSIAQFSDNTFEEQPVEQQESAQVQKRTPLTKEGLARVQEVFAAKEKLFKQRQMLQSKRRKVE